MSENINEKKNNDNQNDKKKKNKYFNNFQCVAGSVFHKDQVSEERRSRCAKR